MPYKDKEKQKEKQREYDQSEKGKEVRQKYYEGNKEKINERRRKLAQREKAKEVKREADKKYAQSEKGKEVKQKAMQKYNQTEKGKEVKQKAQQKYNQSEKAKEAKQKYYNTEHGKKARRIKNWESSGVKSDDWNALYEYYKNCWECENCGIELIEGNYGNNKKCLDHCHITGLFRNVLCNYCNILRKD